MTRLVMVLLLSACAASANAQGCSVSGTAREANGRPLPYAVLRLTNLQSGASAFASADANAAFRFSELDGTSYRLDLLSPPAQVTGSHVPTRSVMGRAADFACGQGQPAHVDIRAVED